MILICHCFVGNLGDTERERERESESETCTIDLSDLPSKLFVRVVGADIDSLKLPSAREKLGIPKKCSFKSQVKQKALQPNVGWRATFQIWYILRQFVRSAYCGCAPLPRENCGFQHLELKNAQSFKPLRTTKMCSNPRIGKQKPGSQMKVSHTFVSRQMFQVIKCFFCVLMVYMLRPKAVGVVSMESLIGFSSSSI